MSKELNYSKAISQAKCKKIGHTVEWTAYKARDIIIKREKSKGNEVKSLYVYKCDKCSFYHIGNDYARANVEALEKESNKQAFLERVRERRERKGKFCKHKKYETKDGAEKASVWKERCGKLTKNQTKVGFCRKCGKFRLWTKNYLDFRKNPKKTS